LNTTHTYLLLLHGIKDQEQKKTCFYVSLSMKLSPQQLTYFLSPYMLCFVSPWVPDLLFICCTKERRVLYGWRVARVEGKTRVEVTGWDGGRWEREKRKETCTDEDARVEEGGLGNRKLEKGKIELIREKERERKIENIKIDKRIWERKRGLRRSGWLHIVDTFKKGDCGPHNWDST